MVMVRISVLRLGRRRVGFWCPWLFKVSRPVLPRVLVTELFTATKETQKSEINNVRVRETHDIARVGLEAPFADSRARLDVGN